MGASCSPPTAHWHVPSRTSAPITPAAEWLVDNFHIVDEQLREIRDDLPADYYRELPKLAEGHLQGYPRVVGLAWAYVAHTDSRFDAESLHRFVDAYQRVEPLTIGELWAIAISLRIVLVENLRRLAELDRPGPRGTAEGERARRRPARPAEGAEQSVTAASLRRLADTALSTAGQVQLFQRLRDQDPAVTPALGWLEELVAARGTSAEEIVRLEHQRQAAMNVTVRNVITSMRLISWFDWAEFVEGLSLVDKVLRDGSSFGSMDFVTRDRYRHAIEQLARRSGRTEVEVARTAMVLAAAPGAAEMSMLDLARLARLAREQLPGCPREGRESSAPASAAAWSADDRLSTPTGRRRDAGRYLISDGRPLLEQALECRVPWTERLRRALTRTATVGYLGTVAAVTALVLALPLWLAAASGVTDLPLLAMAILALIPASDVAVALTNWLVTHLVGPRPLPRLELVGRCAIRPPHARRGPDAPRRRGGHRGAGEPPGGPATSRTPKATCASPC